MKQLLFFFLLSLPTLAQKTFFIKDAATNKGIPYVSIFTSDRTFKINTEPTGSFSVPDEFLGNTFVFDAVGYESKQQELADVDRKSTRLNSSHVRISYAVFCLKKK